MLKHLAFIKRYTHLLGGFVTLVSLIFIGQKIVGHFNAPIEKSLFTIDNLMITVLLSITFAIFSNTLGFAWRFLLMAEGDFIPKNLALSIFGKSQIAKYLPNKLFHVVGRQVLASNAGCSHQNLYKSTIWEVFLHAFSAGFVGSIFLIYSVPSGLTMFYALIVTLVICFAFPSIYRLIEKDRVFALSGYMVFHMIGGLIFAYLISHFSNDALALNQLAIIAGAYCLAWLAGFILPGAPGGLGVREFVLYMLISPWIDDKVLLNAIVVSRIITTLGDVGFFLIGCGLSHIKSSKPTTSYNL